MNRDFITVEVDGQGLYVVFVDHIVAFRPGTAELFLSGGIKLAIAKPPFKELLPLMIKRGLTETVPTAHP